MFKARNTDQQFVTFIDRSLHGLFIKTINRSNNPRKSFLPSPSTYSTWSVSRTSHLLFMNWQSIYSAVSFQNKNVLTYHPPIRSTAQLTDIASIPIFLRCHLEFHQSLTTTFPTPDSAVLSIPTL